MEDSGLFGAARSGSAELHAVPARAWEEAAACRKGGGAVLTRMGTGFTSVLMLPAWLLRKLSAAELAQLLDDPGSGARTTTPAARDPDASNAAAQTPTPRQLARRQRRKRQRARKRTACGTDEEGALASDDVHGGGVGAAPSASAAAKPAGRSTRSRGAAPSAALALCSPSHRDAVVCGGGTPAVVATAAAGPRKRGRAEAESAEAASETRGQELERIDALAATLREELVSDGLPANEIRLRPVLLREGLLPQFPVVRGSSAEKASADKLAGSIQNVLRSTDVPPFDGLRRLILEGSAVTSMSD